MSSFVQLVRLFMRTMDLCLWSELKQNQRKLQEGELSHTHSIYKPQGNVRYNVPTDLNFNSSYFFNIITLQCHLLFIYLRFYKKHKKTLNICSQSRTHTIHRSQYTYPLGLYWLTDFYSYCRLIRSQFTTHKMCVHIRLFSTRLLCWEKCCWICTDQLDELTNWPIIGKASRLCVNCLHKLATRDALTYLRRPFILRRCRKLRVHSVVWIMNKLEKKWKEAAMSYFTEGYSQYHCIWCQN
jgi:hypothetical protein